MATESSEPPKFPFARPENSYDAPEQTKRLRDNGPVSRVQLFDGALAWIVGKHKEVCEMLSSEKLSNDRYGRDGYPELHPTSGKSDAKPTFVQMDNPEHAKQRHMSELFFTPDAAETYRPMIKRIIDGLLDSIKQKGCKDGPVDLVQEFASLVNPRVILSIFGVPENDVDELVKSGAALGGTAGSASESGHTDIHDYLGRLIDERAQASDISSENLVNKLIIDQYRPENLDKDELLRLLFVTFVAGNSATTSSISLGILTLLQHPDQLRAIRENRGLAKQAAEEVTRYHSPSALNSRRVAKEDVTIAGTKIKAGEGVIGSVRAANRDPSVFQDPDRFNIHRQTSPGQNLAFGYGPHICQGQWISRVELELALDGLIQKLPNVRLAVPGSELEYTAPTKNVGLLHLPVLFDS